MLYSIGSKTEGDLIMRKNNKGFTLVELIIVVAIIAILAAVFAPMYMKYLENARVANDKKIAASYMQAATVALLDGYAGDTALTGEWYVFKWGYTTSNTNKMNMHMAEVTKPTDIKHWGSRKPDLQNEVAQTLGFVGEDGKLDESKIPRPESSAVQYESGGLNSFVFYVNRITGEIIIRGIEGGDKWVTDIGIEKTVTYTSL